MGIGKLLYSEERYLLKEGEEEKVEGKENQFSQSL